MQTWYSCKKVLKDGLLFQADLFVTTKPPRELGYTYEKCTEYRTGYLTVPLDYDESQLTNNISLQLRVSAKIACVVDPCPILFYHKGGPGSNDIACTKNDYSGKYNTIGIAQRGIGGDEFNHWLNTPRMEVFNANWSALTINEVKGNPIAMPKAGNASANPNNKIITPESYEGARGLGIPACKTPEAGSRLSTPKRSLDLLDPVEDQAAIREHYRWMQSVMHNCVNDDYWKLPVPGTKVTANFLDYVGTHLLVMDIDRLRIAFGAERLSCYGYSYGTGVCSSYAATFPNRIGARSRG